MLRAIRLSAETSVSVFNDGDVDVVVVEAQGRPELLRNEGIAGASWCSIHLQGLGENRDAMGARVTLQAGGHRQIRERRSSGSYLSANDPRLHFGLGEAEMIDSIDVRWPGGETSHYTQLPVRQFLKLVCGKKEFEILPRK